MKYIAISKANENEFILLKDTVDLDNSVHNNYFIFKANGKDVDSIIKIAKTKRANLIINHIPETQLRG